jgi:hypothetical protein
MVISYICSICWCMKLAFYERHQAALAGISYDFGKSGVTKARIASL